MVSRHRSGCEHFPLRYFFLPLFQAKQIDMSSPSHQLAAVAFLISALSSLQCFAAEGESHPPSVVGEWIGDPVSGCSEVIRFGEDGEIRVNSGSEVLVGTYTTQSMKDAAQKLKVTRTITSSNGAPDCSGSIGNEVGKTRSAFAIWESETVMRLCFDVRGWRCFGRFKLK